MTSTPHRSTSISTGADPGPEPGPLHPSGADVWLGVDGRGLHPRLEAVLRRVQAAERAAAGEHRRPTFRLMRELLGASVRLGVSPRLLADCLGTSPRSLSARASSADDGAISAEMVHQLTELTPGELDRLSHGALGRDGGRPGHETYRTIDVIRALLETPWPEPQGPQSWGTKS